ncbi:MAG: hypothetical protein MK081_12450 [Flavobacteriales bacterium]|nr:hypothetical protein [Flavobacteriales bacterium]
MRNLLLFAAICCLGLNLNAQSDIEYYQDMYEVRLDQPHKDRINPQLQQNLREAGAWKAFSQNNNGWYAIMSPEHHLPHRAWGTPMEIPGSTTQDKAEWFIQNKLSDFGINLEELSSPVSIATKKNDIIRYKQVVNGMEVLGSNLIFKFNNDRLIMFSLDYFGEANEVEATPLSFETLASFATAGIALNNIEVSTDGAFIYALKAENTTDLRLVERIWVKGYESTVPKNYLTLVDATTGEVLVRQNMVQHIAPDSGDKPKKKEKKILTMGMPVVISGQVEGTILPLNVFDEEIEAPLPYLTFNVGGEQVQADVDGGFITSVTGPAEADFDLSGPFCTIFTAGVTPEFSATLDDGYTAVSFDNAANIRELSAYRSTNQIHDHMKAWLPDFDGLDFSLTTNIDVAGECNAFYDGASINFYPNGGGCNSTALLADVVYHEYGHGINNEFYQDNGGFYSNGAMNEGYADWWGLSLTESPLLAQGFYDDSDEPLRRYDIDPKVFGIDDDIQVHSGGEIICGAWYDSHLLMGGDWDASMELFIATYSGLQAEETDNATAFTDVLLDALQEDDDDGDLNNGTPNGLAILEGFDIHGISLFSYTEIEHDPVEFADSGAEVVLIADAEIVFPFGQYFENMTAFYRTELNGEWQSAVMDEVNDEFEVNIGQVEGPKIVEYYFAITDVLGGNSAISPAGANNEVYPNLPFMTLVGVEPALINDSDDYSEFGDWDPSINGDTATTGQWEEDEPVGSTSAEGTPVAPSEDHTPVDFGFCFLTGVSPGPNGGVGENDVDAGHTTLLSPVVDLTEYQNPIFSYWRWYVNAPPGGANPGSDWWQVEVSDDGGDSWIYIENNLTQDVAWRRNAFFISDYVDITNEFQIRFIASDSTTIGENLDGGSLIEAAVDDIVLYDVATGDGVLEESLIDFAVWPNPTNGELRVHIERAGGQLDIIDHKGRLIESIPDQTLGQTVIDLNGYARGQYFVRYTVDGMSVSKLIQLIE